jgi:hypothetical protein
MSDQAQGVKRTEWLDEYAERMADRCLREACQYALQLERQRDELARRKKQ